LEALLLGLGFYLIIEGLFPFLSPQKWKESIAELYRIPNEKIRIAALVSVGLGLLLVWSVNLF
jgi:uncharacterized protein YjeT (DUF2065 family)